jgi:hypothetical protein
VDWFDALQIGPRIWHEKGIAVAAGYWRYRQATGAMYAPDGAIIECGYSGKAPVTNWPPGQCIPDWGCIPQGSYALGEAVDHETCGPCAIPLEPSPENQMFNRHSFLIHGDNEDHTASTGCIILSRAARDEICASSARELVVTL